MDARRATFVALESQRFVAVTLQEECTRAMATAALLKVDHEITEKQVRTRV